MIKPQTYWHVDVNSFPPEVQQAVEYICEDLNIVYWSGSVLRWCISEEQLEATDQFDTAANVLNSFLNKQSQPTFGDGITIFIDL